nr:hypothetical protein Q903MT_gene123 [Picea sitchensis]
MMVDQDSEADEKLVVYLEPVSAYLRLVCFAFLLFVLLP